MSNILIYVLAVLLLTLLVYQSVLLLLLIKVPEDRSAAAYTGDYPLVSVLVAARDEENNIVACMEALDRLSWPKDKIEILIGNDQSTDRTEALIQTYIQQRPHFRLISITHTIGKARGKANVLAQLAHQAQGSFFFITDADIRVHPNWIQGLLANWTPATGIVSGVTNVKGNRLFDFCQNIDWLYAFGMIKVVSEHAIKATAVGNNMMIARDAYFSTGGYENIPFSVTEDFQLFKETIKKGWQYKNLLSQDSNVLTEPVESFAKLMVQRKRWMHGAIQLPPFLLLFLFLQGIFLPMLILTWYYSPLTGALVLVCKVILQHVFIYAVHRRLAMSYQWFKGILSFELYSTLTSIATVLYYLMPGKVFWKGRKY
jgi:cellulose synthase/poly-beta-1,6-N-acetylglucosamine synthase-like glycosyltransferase